MAAMSSAVGFALFSPLIRLPSDLDLEYKGKGLEWLIREGNALRYLERRGHGA
jgi:hypothetical protein